MRGEILKIAFSGTREGMSYRQLEAFQQIIGGLQGTFKEFHHGDCLGSDIQAHDTFRGLSGHKIVLHPSNMNEYRGYSGGDETREPMHPLKRNEVMAAECDILIAAPISTQEKVRSGTWSTVRYFRKQNKPVIILDR